MCVCVYLQIFAAYICIAHIHFCPDGTAHEGKGAFVYEDDFPHYQFLFPRERILDKGGLRVRGREGRRGNSILMPLILVMLSVWKYLHYRFKVHMKGLLIPGGRGEGGGALRAREWGAFSAPGLRGPLVIGHVCSRLLCLAWWQRFDYGASASVTIYKIAYAIIQCMRISRSECTNARKRTCAYHLQHEHGF